MAYEIDYLAVGEGESSADAIALRIIEPSTATQRVIIIDGGTKESGAGLVDLVRARYGTNAVDIVICTHPDADHASGLTVVLEEMEVGCLVMHLPWNHADRLKKMFKDGRLTSTGLERKLTRSLLHASSLEDLALSKHIPVYEPFEGLTGFDGRLEVLGPSQSYYETLVANFDCTPEPKEQHGLLGGIATFVREAIEWVDDNMLVNLLDDSDTTSPENSSSAIVLFRVDDQKLLFTGDAGKTSLVLAADYAARRGIALTDLAFLDVPHHGSKRNAGKTAFEKIKATTAFISAARNSSKHPSKKVMNALKKNGSAVFKTCGRNIWHHDGTPARSDYSPLAPEPFYEKVEN